MLIYITGSSSGIGKALAEVLLDANHQVIGLSRQQTIHHPNYHHISIDLANLKELTDFKFTDNTVDNIVLVNNAGIIGPIKPVGSHTDEQIIDVATINSIAPQILTNKFLNKFQKSKEHVYQIINVSSGAGKRPIDAWSTYCASKASVDLFSETLAEELKLRDYLNWHIFSIAPGVVDTNMQSTIRRANPNDFKSHQKFIDLKVNNDLASSKEVANKLLAIISKPSNYTNTIFSLRDIEL